MSGFYKKQYTSQEKQLNEAAFIQVVDALGSDLEYCSVVQSPTSTINRQAFLNDVTSMQALANGFTISSTSNPLQVIQSRLGRYDSKMLSYSARHLQDLFRTVSTDLQKERRRQQHISI
jgi:hypothetical protein